MSVKRSSKSDSRSTRNRRSEHAPRRNKLFGLWVAEKLGKSGDDALVYAKELVATAIDGGEAAVGRKITGDLATKSISVDEAALRAKFDELAALAAAQVKAGT